LAGKAFFAEFDYQISLPLEIGFGPNFGPSKALYQPQNTLRCNETPFKTIHDHHISGMLQPNLFTQSHPWQCSLRLKTNISITQIK
jgi:hypothetical protein